MLLVTLYSRLCLRSSEEAEADKPSRATSVDLTLSTSILYFLLRNAITMKTFLRICVSSFRSKSTIIPLRRWEVLPQQVIFEDEIGRGAFGKVFKGTFKESPGIEVFYEPRRDTVDFRAGRTVAIKVLGGMYVIAKRRVTLHQ